MSQWSQRYPGALQRPTLLSRPAEQGVREMSIRRLETPCDILDKRTVPDGYGGAGSEQTVILASVLCDVEPLSRTTETPPTGFENEMLYRVYLPSTQSIPLSARLRIPGWLPEWQPSQDVELGALRIATGEFGDGHFYKCIQAGTTGANEPVRDTRKGGTTQDGTAVWKESGKAFTLEVKQHDAERSRDTQICVIAQLLQ